MAYTTPYKVKNYLGIASSADDALLLSLIAAAQNWLDMRTERTFEALVDATRYADAEEDVNGDELWVPGDLCQITSVTNGDGVVVAAASYVTQPRRLTPYYALRLKSSKGLSWTYTTDPENAIAIVGRWAYSLTPPADIVWGCERLAAYLYRQKDAQTFDVTAQLDLGVITVPAGFPKDIGQLLNKYTRTV